MSFPYTRIYETHRLLDINALLPRMGDEFHRERLGAGELSCAALYVGGCAGANCVGVNGVYPVSPKTQAFW